MQQPSARRMEQPKRRSDHDVPQLNSFDSMSQYPIRTRIKRTAAEWPQYGGGDVVDDDKHVDPDYKHKNTIPPPYRTSSTVGSAASDFDEIDRNGMTRRRHMRKCKQTPPASVQPDPTPQPRKRGKSMSTVVTKRSASHSAYDSTDNEMCQSRRPPVAASVKTTRGRPRKVRKTHAAKNDDDLCLERKWWGECRPHLFKSFVRIERIDMTLLADCSSDRSSVAQQYEHMSDHIQCQPETGRESCPPTSEVLHMVNSAQTVESPASRLTRRKSNNSDDFHGFSSYDDDEVARYTNSQPEMYQFLAAHVHQQYSAMSCDDDNGEEILSPQYEHHRPPSIPLIDRGAAPFDVPFRCSDKTCSQQDLSRFDPLAEYPSVAGRGRLQHSETDKIDRSTTAAGNRPECDIQGSKKLRMPKRRQTVCSTIMNQSGMFDLLL